MNRVLIYSENIKIPPGPGCTPLYASNKNELAYLLVSEKEASCLVMELTGPDEPDIDFLTSVRLNFPLLQTAIVLPGAKAKMLSAESSIFKDAAVFDPSSPDLTDKILGFIAASENTNRRSGNRFCWPLTAEFRTADGITHELEIFSISSGGAYLKSEKLMPRPGTGGMIRIKFKNSGITTQCTVNDYRMRSSNYPFGFSVSFTTLSQQAKEELDRLVDDAIVKILLDPMAKPEVPALDSEMLSPDAFTL